MRAPPLTLVVGAVGDDIVTGIGVLAVPMLAIVVTGL
jgi:hypothetical protein